MFNINSVDDSKKQGTWAKFSGGEFLIASMHNPEFLRTLTRLQRPYKKEIEKDKLDPEISTELTCEAIAAAILIDWKNVGDGSKEIPYSREAAKQALITNPDFRLFVTDFAGEIDNFRREEVEKISKK